MPIPKPPKFVNVAIMTTITIIFWVFFSVYNILTTDIEPSTPSEILAPLNPGLNIQTLDIISESIHFDDSQIVGLNNETEEIKPVENEIEIEVIPQNDVENEQVDDES